MIDKKNKLRTIAKNIRKNLPMKEISLQLTDLIRKNKFYQDAKNVMIFYPAQYEVDLRNLLNDDKNFYLPKVKGNNLLICPYCEELKKSTLGVYEPCSNPVDAKVLDLVITPALMADKNGYRLGYGGGFYDRFINKYGKYFKTICPVPKELLITELPVGEFDQKIDLIITND